MNLMKIGMMCDWISPAVQMVRNVIDDGVVFSIARESLSLGNPETVLKRHGIETWGGYAMDDQFVFSLKREDEELAVMVLRREMGIKM